MANSPLNSGFITSFGTMVSRIFGMLRDIVFAYTFGSGSSMDAFLIAFKIPNFFRRIFAEGAFTQAFLPVLIEFQTKQDEQRLKAFLAHILGLLIVVCGAVTLLGVLIPKPFIFLFAGGITDNAEQLALTASMLRITSPYLFFITLTSYYIALQHSHRQFAVPAFTPVILNLVIISFALYLHTTPPIMALAWGAFIAGIMQFLVQLPFSLSSLTLPKFRLRLHPTTHRFIGLIFPAILSSSVVQLNILIDTAIASFLIAGSISWLYFADRIIYLPLSLFGLAITVVILPYLSRSYQKKFTHRYRSILLWGIHLSLILSLPAALGIILLAQPITITIYQHGAFNMESAIQTAAAIQAYALGLPAFILIKVLSSAFFARQNTKTPLKIAVVSTLTSITLSLILMWFLAHIGLALATSLASILNVSLLTYVLYRNKLLILRRPTFRLFGQIVIALAILGLLVSYLAPQSNHWVAMQTIEQIFWLGITIVSAALAYFLCLFATGLKWQSINPRWN